MELKYSIDENGMDTAMETGDWRFSAAILGLLKYLRYWESKGEDVLYEVENDVLKYRSSDLTEERYLLFVEEFYSYKMHHLKIENLLNQDELSEEDCILLKGLLNGTKSNTICKTTFKNIDYTEKGIILELVNKYRLKLIKETFKNSIYKDTIASSSSIFSKDKKTCRTLGCYIDIGKKKKVVSYKGNYGYTDCIEFDFIPFAFSDKNFSGSRFFINNNLAIKQLEQSNIIMDNIENKDKNLFEYIKRSSSFNSYNIEIITSDSKNINFLSISKKAEEIINNIDFIEYIKPFKDGVDIKNEVIKSIIENKTIDIFILTMFKNKTNNTTIDNYIKINNLLYGGLEMNNEKLMKMAYMAAQEINNKIPENKIMSYKIKLINTLVQRNRNKICELLLHLSIYSGVRLYFADNIFESTSNYNNNINVIYKFINNLGNKNNNKGENK